MITVKMKCGDFVTNVHNSPEAIADAESKGFSLVTDGESGDGGNAEPAEPAEPVEPVGNPEDEGGGEPKPKAKPKGGKAGGE